MPEAADRLGGEGFVWLALRDPSDEELEEVEQRFDLPPLAVEDARESHQRPKIEDYDDDWFVVLKAASYDDAREAVDFDEIQMFAGESYAVVVRDGATNHLDGARKRLADRPHLLEQGPIAVVWAVLDTVVDDYEPVLDGLERDIEDVEKAIFEEGARPDPAHLLPAPRARPLLPCRAPAAQRAAGAGARHDQARDDEPDARVLPRRRRPPPAAGGGDRGCSATRSTAR